ncbi:MAG: restriction endonuclease subunit S [Gammaproteobacteria bacterium]|nr:restriction endonuclease subunit S [Gammaproteobacteria bacterium]
MTASAPKKLSGARVEDEKCPIFRAYPEYKESGVAWIGLIPAHWSVKRAKYLFSLAKRPVSDDDGIVTAFRDGQVTLRSNRRADGFTNALKEIGYQGVRKGDLVIHAMDAFAGAVGVSESDGKCSPVYSCCIPAQKSDSEFYARLVRTMSTTGFIESLAKGIRERSTDFRWGDFYVQYLPHPPLSEQVTIREYLKRETARIDNLISEKQNFINLLKEKRQALISHVVTKGLDPKAKMKDSGIEWIGEVPEHWEVISVRHLIMGRKIELQDGNHGELHPTADEYVDDGIPFLMANNVRNGWVDIDGSKKISKERADKLRIGFARAGDVLLTHKGTVGEVGIVPDKIEQPYWMLTPQVTYYRCLTDELLSEFLMYSFMSKGFLTQLELIGGKQSTRSYVGILAQRSLMAAVPPRHEQEKICDYLEEQIGKLDELISEVNRSVEFLKEHRTTLISAAVTGKIDVRE